MSRRTIIDFDPGIDDALALFLAVGSQALNLTDVITVGGNVSVDQATSNARHLLSVLGNPGIRVTAGLNSPAVSAGKTAEHIHGPDGLAGLNRRITGTGATLRDEEVIERLIDVYTRGGSVDVIALGPLTNVAAVLRRYPEVRGKIHRIVAMGGSIAEKGNVTPHAEFNFFADPAAANLVLDSSVETTVVPLDVTHQCILRRSFLQKIEDPEVDRFVQRLVAYYQGSGADRFDSGACPLHDPLAVGVALDASFVSTRELHIAVEDAGEKRGSVLVDSDARGSPVHVCVSVASNRFLNFFAETLKSL